LATAAKILSAIETGGLNILRNFDLIQRTPKFLGFKLPIAQ